MKKLLIIVFVFFSLVAFAEEVYYVLDKNGNLVLPTDPKYLAEEKEKKEELDRITLQQKKIEAERRLIEQDNRNAISLDGYIVCQYESDELLFRGKMLSLPCFEIALSEYNSTLRTMVPSKQHALLYTKNTLFSSKGRFNLKALKIEERPVELNEDAGNFTDTWDVYLEVDQPPIPRKKRR